MADIEHPNNHHRDTLSQILQHPMRRNVEWTGVVALLEVAGHDDSVARARTEEG